MANEQLPLDKLPTERLPEPCVNCEQDAAPNWLTCTNCAASIADGLVLALGKKRGKLERWLADAELALEALQPDDPRRTEGNKLWLRRLRIYERLSTMLDRVVA